MATRTETTLVDDLDGTQGGETVTFSYRGKDYAIDLSKNHADEMDQVLARYIGAGRQQAPARGRRVRPRANRDDSALCRAWLKTQPEGADLKERGRIPADMIQRWEDAGYPRVSTSAPAGSFSEPRLS